MLVITLHILSHRKTSELPRLFQTVTLDGETIIWDRKVDGGFPEPKDLKRIIRDKIAPSKKLGHSDYDHIDSVLPDMDDDEAEEMRAYFGVL